MMINTGKFDELFLDMKNVSTAVEEFILNEFEDPDSDIDEVASSMKYSLFAGGKRIRPYLTLAFCRLFGGDDRAAMPFAAALEMIHTFSLIHDDLPCMDDDNMRRGKPTNHMVYGEATALLAGDALAIKAFGTAAKNIFVSSGAIVEAIKVLSHSAAECGMVGGQIMDMAGERAPLSLEKLKKLQSLKTGALIKAAAMLGLIAAGVDSNDERYNAAVLYAEKIGLAFQIVDDILDVEGDADILGKPIGSDEENSKNTFISHMSVSEAREYAGRLTKEAKSAVEKYKGGDNLLLLADYLLCRNS